MKRIYKILIAVCVMVSVLLCCCFSASAKSYDSAFIGDSSRISYYRYVTTDGVYHHVDDFRFNWSGSNFSTGFFPEDGDIIYNILVAFEPDADFIYYIDKNKYYTFSFRAGTIGSADITSSLKDVAVALKDSNGNLAVSYNSVKADTSSAVSWYDVTFTPEQLQRIDNIVLVQFQFLFDPALDIGRQYLRLDFQSYCKITETNPSVDEITGSISDSTDKITGGWIPSPDTPEGSESVGELDSIEQELQSSSEEGIEAGLSMITSIPDTIFKFRSGLMFFISMSNEIMQIEWLTTLLTIGLSIGIVAFLLNISGSIFSKVSRDNAKRSSGSNNKKSG